MEIVIIIILIITFFLLCQVESLKRAIKKYEEEEKTQQEKIPSEFQISSERANNEKSDPCPQNTINYASRAKINRHSPLRRHKRFLN